MLIEGSGPPAGDGSEDQAKRERKPAAPGTTRLQQYTAEPSAVATPAAAPTPFAEGSGAAALAAAYGQGGPPPIVPGSQAEALAQGYALQRGETPATATEREALTVPEQEQQAKTYRARRSKEMSWDDYLGLSDRGRAAVDFNTMLIQARQKDLRQQDDYAPNDAQREVYDKTVERMFGETGVSETFAPETVALLSDINFEGSDAKRFDDLDDFLGLASALTAKDIDRIGQLKMSPVERGAEAVADLANATTGSTEAPAALGGTVTALAAGTNDLQESLTKGNQILENWKQVTASTRNESLSFLGGIPNNLASPDIRLNKADDEYFQLAFDTLADATNGPEVLGLIEKDLGPERMKQFLRYADTKSQYSVDQQAGLGGNPAIQYRSPDEFRQILGLKGGETGGTG